MAKTTFIDRAIEVNEKHIKEYQLESNTGTKKMQEKFYRNAVKQRNNYVINQQKEFDVYKKEVYREMKKRVDKCFPTNNDSAYKNEEKSLNNVKQVIKFTNSFINSSYKLGFTSIISNIKEENDCSLEAINNILEEFISKFKEANIILTIDDFSYTMFTRNYMLSFFKKLKGEEVDLGGCFEEIYWECPDFLKHLKLNLWSILNKYQKELDSYCLKIETDKLQTYNLTSENIVSNYYDKLNTFNDNIDRDSYINLETFLSHKRNINDYLENSSVRKNNFNSLASNNNFLDLDDASKERYYLEVLDLDKTLNVLKLYYRYEFIVKDLQEKFKKLAESKTLYENKLKEIKKEEGIIKKIYSSYLRSSGIGFLAKKDEKKISASKLKMNAEIVKLYGLYNELHDLEIIYNMSKQLSDISSLYDLFMVAYSSYYYLEEMFLNNLKENDDFSLEEEFERYFDFIYNPNNLFLTKINAFTTYDIADIVADKYRLLELNITKDNITKDSINSILDTVRFIKLVKNIDDGNLSLDKMNFIVKFKEFDEVIFDDGDLDVEFLN